ARRSAEATQRVSQLVFQADAGHSVRVQRVTAIGDVCAPLPGASELGGQTAGGPQDVAGSDRWARPGVVDPTERIVGGPGTLGSHQAPAEEDVLVEGAPRRRVGRIVGQDDVTVGSAQRQKYLLAVAGKSCAHAAGNRVERVTVGI